MKHALITRFNIASPGREFAIRTRPGWLDRRFELFERYCLPSVAAQSCRDFAWLIYFDEQTPDEYKARVEALRSIFPFEPRYCRMFERAQIIADVSARFPERSGMLVSTRFDNDDGLHRDFIAAVQDEAKDAAPGTIINFPNGYALGQGGLLYTARDTSNPFTSLVEDYAQDFTTIWTVQHIDLATRYAVRQGRPERLWLQVVHGENVTNRIKGRRVGDADVGKAFAIGDAGVIALPGPGALLLDHVVMAPARRLRERLIAIAKRLLRRGRAPQ